MPKKSYKLLILLVISTMLLSILTGCGTKELQQVEKNEVVLGTFGSIRVFTTAPAKGEAAIDKAYQRITDIENKMSTSIAGSEVYKINENAGQNPIEVSPDTLFVIEEALNYEAITRGAFNIGIGSLIDLWGIGKDWQKVPTQQEIDETLNHIDITQLEIQGNQVSIKDPKMMIDLGGIAKGYSVDEAVRVLKESGIENGFVNLGGDVYALGTKPDGTPWMIGIQNPEIGTNTVMARLPISNQSVVSSGDYERYFIQDNVQYHHILDPETGYPTDNRLASVTVVSEKAIDGDVLSTAVFVMGLEKGLLFLEELKDIEGVIITKDKQVFATSGVKDKLEILDKSFKLVQ